MKTASLALMLLLLTGVAFGQSVELEFRLYDVSAITEHRFHSYGARLGQQGSREYYEEMEEKEPSQFISVDALADYIRDTVEPNSWDSGGDVMGMEGGLLLVKSRPAVQKKIEEFLGRLAAGASQRIEFAVEVYELEDSRYPTLVADQVPKGAVQVESLSGEAWPGVTTAVQVTNRVRYVGDYDVEIAQSSNISDPRVMFAIEGVSVELIARPTIDGDRLVIDTIVQCGKFDRPFRELELGIDEENFGEPYRSPSPKNLGIIQLPVFHQFGAVSTVIVPANGTFTIPVVSDGKTLLLRVKTKMLGSKLPDSILSTDALCHRPELVYFGDHPEMEEEDAALMAPMLQRRGNDLPPFFPGPEELLDFIVQNVAPWYWEEDEAAVAISERHDVIVKASDDILQAVRKFVGDLERQKLRQVHFDVRVLSTTAKIEPGARDAFPEGTPLYAGTVSTLPGGRTSFQVGNTMNYLAEYDVEVAQEARISDPIIGQSFEGLIADLQPQLSFSGDQIITRMKLLLSHRRQGEVFESGARFLGPIDQISERRHQVDTTVTIPTGSVFVLDAGVNPQRPGERLLVAVKASVR